MSNANSNDTSNSTVFQINQSLVRVNKYINWIIEKHGSCTSTWETIADRSACSPYEAACAVNTLVELGKYRLIKQDVFGDGKMLNVIYKA